MSSATLETTHTLRCRLAAQVVEADLGVIRGCTVGKADVHAEGKYVLVDANGAVTTDEKLAKRKLPVFTDAKFLDTLMTAAKAAGKRIKTREDHDDGVGARAGFADTFKRITDGDGDRVVADIHVFKSYRNRDVLLETVQETPSEIGLSIDLTPTFEIEGNRALMRVAKLNAVDVVDQGAITPDGLFLSASLGVSVDTLRKVKPIEQPLPDLPMADQPNPNADVLAAIGQLAKTMTDCMAKFAAPAAAPSDEALKAVKAENEKLAATLKEQGDQLKTVVAGQAQLKKERALLGFRGTEAERALLSVSGSAEDIEKLNAGKKSYLQLVADARTANAKLSPGDAHDLVQKSAEGKAAYALHLNAKGVTGRQTMAAA